MISFSKTPRIKVVTDKKGVVSVALKRNHTVIIWETCFEDISEIGQTSPSVRTIIAQLSKF